ncbi:MAG: 50S ribosomal protein L3 N(5)-glutamine methyltransferase [Thioalkalivibrionaceae bacterium]
MVEHREDQHELQTVRDWVRYGASRFRAAELFFGHGTDNAFDEAAWLVLHALSMPLDLPETWWDCRVTRAEAGRIRALIEAREHSREPAAYLTGEALFAGISFASDARALVPRSPIAELIPQCFSPWIDAAATRAQAEARAPRILDLCTGSGCIGLATAIYWPEAAVVATDLSRAALALAEENRRRLRLEARVRLLQSDVFDALAGEPPFDLIVSNPPYVDADDIGAMPPEFHREPRIGLAAGRDGLDIVRRILADAASFLTEDGVMIVEVGASQPAFEATFPRLPVTWLEFEHGGEGVFVVDRHALLIEGALDGADEAL